MYRTLFKNLLECKLNNKKTTRFLRRKAGWKNLAHSSIWQSGILANWDALPSFTEKLKEFRVKI